MALAAVVKKQIMNDDTMRRRIDPNLDVPAEANTTKHINFTDEEDTSTPAKHKLDRETEERRTKWQEGVQQDDEIQTSDES